MKPKPSFFLVSHQSPQNEASPGLASPQQSGLNLRAGSSIKFPAHVPAMELNLRSLVTQIICDSVMNSLCSQPDSRQCQQERGSPWEQPWLLLPLPTPGDQLRVMRAPAKGLGGEWMSCSRADGPGAWTRSRSFPSPALLVRAPPAQDAPVASKLLLQGCSQSQSLTPNCPNLSVMSL